MVLPIIALFSSKINRLVKGRKETKVRLSQLPAKQNKRIWIHVASLGEYEMCLPLVQELNQLDANIEWIFSFFSPSGYENAKLPANATKFYMLSDTNRNAKLWLNTVAPDLIVIVKYEFWINHLNTGFEINIPNVYWNFQLRENHFLTKFWAQPWRNALKNVNRFYVLDHTSLKLAEYMEFNAVFLGDIRYTRAKELQDSQKFPIPSNLIEYCKNNEILILGSSWQEEELALSLYLTENPLKENSKIIIAPHDIGAAHIQEIENRFAAYSVSRFSGDNFMASKILILDGIGLLSRIYKLADLALIGGGLGKGLHNCIEAVAAGIPVIFGTKTHKSPEIYEFMDLGFGFGGTSPAEIAQLIKTAREKSPEELQSLKNKIQQHLTASTPNIAKTAVEIHSLI